MLKHWYLSVIAGCVAVSVLAWLSVVFFISTDDLGGAGVILFLGSLYAALFSSLLLFFYYLRIRVFKFSPPFREFHSVFRESALVAAAAIIWLILGAAGRAGIINTWLLIALVVLIDAFFIFNYDKRGRQKT